MHSMAILRISTLTMENVQMSVHKWTHTNVSENIGNPLVNPRIAVLIGH